MTAPDVADRPEPTIVDPGRSRRDEDSPTQLDPGRRPVPTSWVRNLPPGLGARFEVLRELTGNGQQADVLLVRDRASGLERVLKVYRRPWRPDGAVWAYLPRRRSPYVVEVVETGEEAGRHYEIMEHLAGGDLFEWRVRNGAADPARLTEIVRQLAEALAELHEANVVHRDVKPSNLLIRRLDPFEVAVADLGISRSVVDEAFTSTRGVGTLRYTPPEFLGGGQLRPAYDWWSLGVTVVELATGRPMYEGVDDDVLRAHLTSRSVSVAAVGDERLRLLCAGLLISDPDERWGAEQVGRWLAGESPAVAAPRGAVDTGTTTTLPFEYRGVAHLDREVLATAMTDTWEYAATWLCGTDRGPRERLAEWLRQFPADPPLPRPRRRAPINVRLLYRLRLVDPTHPPMYRGWNVTPGRLPELAQEAFAGEGVAADVVAELWREDLLPLLATGQARPGLGGGEGLGVVLRRWREEQTRLRDLTAAVPDEEPRAELRRLLAADGPSLLALSLYAATASEPARAQIRRTLLERDQELRLPWFTALVARPECLWLAYALIAFATGRALARDVEERQRRANLEFQRRTEWLREWARRQARPQALARAVSGVLLLGVVLFVLVGVGDMAEVVSDATVLDAWFAVVAALAATLLFESVLAWEIGGDFHPEYSLIGAGMIAIGRAARGVTGRWAALAAVAVVLGGFTVLTVFLPVATPLAMAGLVMVWAVGRYLSWRAARERQRAELAQVEVEAAAQAA